MWSLNVCPEFISGPGRGRGGLGLVPVFAWMIWEETNGLGPLSTSHLRALETLWNGAFFGDHPLKTGLWTPSYANEIT